MRSHIIAFRRHFLDLCYLEYYVAKKSCPIFIIIYPLYKNWQHFLDIRTVRIYLCRERGVKCINLCLTFLPSPSRSESLASRSSKKIPKIIRSYGISFTEKKVNFTSCTLLELDGNSEKGTFDYTESRHKSFFAT